MKISKIAYREKTNNNKQNKDYNIRAAVANKNGHVEGVLYKIPGKGEIDIEQQMKNKDKSVRHLYSVFNQIQIGTEPQKWAGNEKLSEEENNRRAQQQEIKIQNYEWENDCSEYVKQLQSTVNNVLFFSNKKSSSQLKEMYENTDVIKNMQKSGKPKKFSGGELDAFVAYTLRKSLIVSRKEFDSVKAMVVFIKNIGNDNIPDKDKETICELANLIRDDFLKLNPNAKKSQMATMVRSIRNQNMVVQPQKDRLSFPLVSDQDKNTVTNKNIEKKGLDEFILNYANLDKEERQENLRKLRRIIDVYFSTPKEYKRDMDIILPDDVDNPKSAVWEKHESGKKETEFVEIPDELLKSETKKLKLDVVLEKQARKKLTDSIRKQNMMCYRYTRAVVEKYNLTKSLFFENDSINQYWIHHIENAVERILKSCTAGTLFKLHKGYLTEKVWKDAINLICIKYIALGKAVYNFAMDDIWKDKKDKNLGIIDEKIKHGITSFDYEMIKAQETLQRELAVNVAFAANNLARAVCDMANLKDKESDFLLWNKKDIANKLKNKDDMASVSAVLQFFGGKSSWDIDAFREAYKGNKHNYEVCFIDDLRKAVYSARNDSFHFKTALVNDDIWNTEFFGKLFIKETEFCLEVEKDRFYSNNLPMFYSNDDLRKIMNHIYSNKVSRASQVPSYNSVLVRKSFPEYIIGTLKYQKPGYDEDTLEKWYSACYYLLKEIYYNSFLQSDKALALFEESVKNLKGYNKDREFAVNNFRNSYKNIQSLCTSFSQVCQMYMTEYNQQNNQFKKVRSSKNSSFDKPIYQHYKLLLKKVIANAFASYLQQNEELFGFIGKPLKTNSLKEIKKEQFLPEWTSKKYVSLCEEVGKSPELQKWYIVGKFLNSRSLNLMAGSMRSYIQYVNDIKRRADGIGNELHVISQNVDVVDKWVQVIEVCLLLSSRVSNEFEDYFYDKDDYATYLKSYVDFENSDMHSEYSALVEFSDQGNVDLYVDSSKPKVNRNIVQSKLFAADYILRKIIKPVSKDEIGDFYNQKDEITTCKIKGAELTDEEQKKILKYQKLKNRVELCDVVEYGEIINELLGQLINWSFMRERDLLYFQLGFHYNCLRNDSAKPEEYKNLVLDDVSIKDAILHQIIGMYVNGVAIYAPGKDKNKLESQCAIGGAGGKIGAFCRYSLYLKLAAATLYNAGLELFEVVAEHDDIIKLRNSIDHFKYYLGGYGSILSIYSEVFDRFFTYDMKYQKNVLNILQNILLRHNVIVEPIFESGTKKIGKGTKPCAKLSIRSIISDSFEYKIKDGTLIVDAKDKRYLETIKEILFYPEVEPEVRIISSKDSFEQNNQCEYMKGKSENNKNKKKKNNGNRDGKKKSDGLTYNPFLNLSFELPE